MVVRSTEEEVAAGLRLGVDRESELESYLQLLVLNRFSQWPTAFYVCYRTDRALRLILFFQAAVRLN